MAKEVMHKAKDIIHQERSAYSVFVLCHLQQGVYTTVSVCYRLFAIPLFGGEYIHMLIITHIFHHGRAILVRLTLPLP